MGYYNYLCELLRPLRVYRLDEGSLSGAELYAAGEGLDAVAEALEKAAREGVLMTAEDEGLSRRERLFSRVGARTTPALRRLAIASLLRVGGDGFTLEAVNQTISGCGVRAVAAETDEQGVVRVTFPQVAGEPEDFAKMMVSLRVGAAMERDELLKKLSMMQTAMQQSVQKTLKLSRQRLNSLAEKRVLQSPLNYVEDRRVLLDFLSTRLHAAGQKTLHEKKQRFVRLTAALDAMSPLKVLSRGYSMVTDETGTLVTSAGAVTTGQRIHVSLRSGSLTAQVEQIQEEDKNV